MSKEYFFDTEEEAIDYWQTEGVDNFLVLDTETLKGTVISPTFSFGVQMEGIPEKDLEELKQKEEFKRFVVSIEGEIKTAPESKN